MTGVIGTGRFHNGSEREGTGSKSFTNRGLYLFPLRNSHENIATHEPVTHRNEQNVLNPSMLVFHRFTFEPYCEKKLTLNLTESLSLPRRSEGASLKVSRDRYASTQNPSGKPVEKEMLKDLKKGCD